MTTQITSLKELQTLIDVDLNTHQKGFSIYLTPTKKDKN